MTKRLGIVFRKVRTTSTYIPYFIGKADLGDNKIIHLGLLRSHKQTIRYIVNNQFDIDRLTL